MPCSHRRSSVVGYRRAANVVVVMFHITERGRHAQHRPRPGRHRRRRERRPAPVPRRGVGRDRSEPSHAVRHERQGVHPRTARPDRRRCMPRRCAEAERRHARRVRRAVREAGPHRRMERPRADGDQRGDAAEPDGKPRARRRTPAARQRPAGHEGLRGPRHHDAHSRQGTPGPRRAPELLLVAGGLHRRRGGPSGVRRHDLAAAVRVRRPRRRSHEPHPRARCLRDDPPARRAAVLLSRRRLVRGGSNRRPPHRLGRALGDLEPERLERDVQHHQWRLLRVAQRVGHAGRRSRCRGRSGRATPARAVVREQDPGVGRDHRAARARTGVAPGVPRRVPLLRGLRVRLRLRRTQQRPGVRQHRQAAQCRLHRGVRHRGRVPLLVRRPPRPTPAAPLP